MRFLSNSPDQTSCFASQVLIAAGGGLRLCARYKDEVLASRAFASENGTRLHGPCVLSLLNVVSSKQVFDHLKVEHGMMEATACDSLRKPIAIRTKISALYVVD